MLSSAVPAPASLPLHALIILISTVGSCLLFYICVLRSIRRYPKTINTNAGMRVQKFAPVVYSLVILGSLAETTLASYLFIQYLYNGNYPSIHVRNSVGLLLGIGASTTIVAALFSILFRHASWSMLPISSVGSHAVWIIMTLIIWAVGGTTLFLALPQVLKAGCDGLAYCLQIRILLYLAVGEVGVFIFCLFSVLYLAYQALLRGR